MSDDWQDVDAPQIDRDRFGRPMIIPPEGGKPTPYTRCTTFVGALEDTYNLGRWQQRMVAHGLSTRPDLLLKVSSLGAEPDKLVFNQNTNTYAPNVRHAPWKAAMDETCDQAQEAARAHAKATVGTALHALAERIDREEDVGIVPTEYLPHLGAYAAITDGWTWLEIERFCVVDALKVGGTPDRIAYVPGYDKPMICDLKTGDVTYGQGKIAMQLAMYSRSQLYDIDGTRRPLPNGIDQDLGLVIALNAQTAEAELYEVDLASAWEAIGVAHWVRQWRAKRGLLSRVKPRRQTSQASAGRASSSATSARAARLFDRVRAAQSAAELTQLWRDNKDVWSDELTRAATERKAGLKA